MHAFQWVRLALGALFFSAILYVEVFVKDLDNELLYVPLILVGYDLKNIFNRK